MAGTTCSYATRLTVPGPSRSALNAPLQFLYASFTSTPAPQESRRPAVGVPVKFTLSNPALGTLNTSEVETNAEGIAEVQFTANTDHQRGFLLATAGSAEKKIPLEVVRPAPTKVLLIAGLLTLIAVVVTVVVTKKGDIKPLPPPVIP
ncbi:MAG: hypothetical protein HYR56_11680 [Acidobacteria bacterium]|nr:hypothetical protein [Acidobacteriota bacterium]